MKRFIITATMLAIALQTLYAQSAETVTERKFRERPSVEERVERHVKMLDERLNLTDKQEKKVKSITEKYFREAEKEDLRRPDFREMNGKIEKVLDQRQKDVFDNMRPAPHRPGMAPHRRPHHHGPHGRPAPCHCPAMGPHGKPLPGHGPAIGPDGKPLPERGPAGTPAHKRRFSMENPQCPLKDSLSCPAAAPAESL